MNAHRAAGPRRRIALWIVCLICSGSTAVLADEIVGSARGKVYHTRACKASKNISEENRVVFASVKEAEDAGRRLCNYCARMDEKGDEKPEDDKGDGGGGGRKKNRDAQSGGDRADEDRRADTGGQAPAGLPTEGRIKDVLPGGTLVLDNGEHAALLGVVCPCRGQPNDRRSARAFEKLLVGRTVQLSYDPRQDPWQHRDELGRLRVYVKVKDGEADAAAALITDGSAWLDRSVEFDRKSKYDGLEGQAWGLRRGVWEQLETDAGMARVVAGKHAPHYHALDCAHRAHLIDAEPITLNEARLRRLTPCCLFEEDDEEEKE